MKIIAAIALFFFWFVLSGSTNPLHITAGVIVASAIAWLNPAGTRRIRRVSGLSAVLYVPWLFGRIMKSGFHVSRLILSPTLPIAPELITHKTRLTSDGELVALGNSITLTPGTITVEVAPGELLVHSIDEESRKDLLQGVFDAKLGEIFLSREDKL